MTTPDPAPPRTPSGRDDGRTGTACTSCGASYLACTQGLAERGACCPRCGYTGTHDERTDPASGPELVTLWRWNTTQKLWAPLTVPVLQSVADAMLNGITAATPSNTDLRGFYAVAVPPATPVGDPDPDGEHTPRTHPTVAALETPVPDTDQPAETWTAWAWRHDDWVPITTSPATKAAAEHVAQNRTRVARRGALTYVTLADDDERESWRGTAYLARRTADGPPTGTPTEWAVAPDGYYPAGNYHNEPLPADDEPRWTLWSWDTLDGDAAGHWTRNGGNLTVAQARASLHNAVADARTVWANSRSPRALGSAFMVAPIDQQPGGRPAAYDWAVSPDGAGGDQVDARSPETHHHPAGNTLLAQLAELPEGARVVVTIGPDGPSIVGPARIHAGVYRTRFRITVTTDDGDLTLIPGSYLAVETQLPGASHAHVMTQAGRTGTVAVATLWAELVDPIPVAQDTP